jgi:regulator of sigma E protease
MTIAQPSLPFTVLVFVAVIGVLVFVHEFGHYYTARLLGVRSEAFSIGFGREIAGWTDRSGTRWKLGWLPLGGYVKFAGDLNAASQPDATIEDTPLHQREGLFHFAPLWKKSLITFAGPAVNFLLAILIFAVFFVVYGRIETPSVIAAVQPGSAAAAAGIVAGDRIVAIDGRRIATFEDILKRVTLNTGEPMAVGVARDGVVRTLDVRPKVVFETDRFGNRYQSGRLGLQSGRPDYRPVSVFAAIPAAVSQTAYITSASLQGLWQVISGRRSVKELGGPIKMAQLSGQQATMGIATLIAFVATISINLGFMNLLPVPMLDGGHLFLYALEAIRRKPLGQRVQELAFMSGFAALISLMVLLTFNDLGSVGVWKHLTGLLG